MDVTVCYQDPLKRLFAYEGPNKCGAELDLETLKEEHTLVCVHRDFREGQLYNTMLVTIFMVIDS